MTDYAVIEDDDLERMVERVREFIKAGWEPIGGIAVLYSTWKDEDGWERHETMHYQAMQK